MWRFSGHQVLKGKLSFQQGIWCGGCELIRFQTDSTANLNSDSISTVSLGLDYSDVIVPLYSHFIEIVKGPETRSSLNNRATNEWEIFIISCNDLIFIQPRILNK